MKYYRKSKNEKILFFGKKIAQVWAVTLNKANSSDTEAPVLDLNLSITHLKFMINWMILILK